MEYEAFIGAKRVAAHQFGYPCCPEEVNPLLLPHQRDLVLFNVRGGRRADFASFGLGKTFINLETVRLARLKSGCERALIVLPLGVIQEFTQDIEKLNTGEHEDFSDEQRSQLRDWQVGRPERLHAATFIRSTGEAAAPGLYLTNYESVRAGKIDLARFGVVSLDEAAIMRGFGGVLTFRELMKLEHSEIPRFVFTATPSPNDYIELLAYAAWLGICDVGQGKTRFFKRDSTRADNLTLHPHKEEEFFHWLLTWSVFLQRPSDLGYSDEGYDLPELVVHWHEVPTNHATAKPDKRGQGSLIKDASLGVQESAAEKRESLEVRLAKAREIWNEDPEAHWLHWHDLEDERRAIERAIPGVVSVYGSQDLEERERHIIDFSAGRIKNLAGKPVMLGQGCNFQRHCHKAIYYGIGFKFADFIQSVHRLHRFLQKEPVHIHLIYTEAERRVRESLERKWRDHERLVARTTELIRRYGLASGAIEGSQRSMGVERQESAGESWRLVHNDCVLEAMEMPDNSVDLILTSIPFGNQYEYSPSLNDFGHTDDNEHFWCQMDFLIPELLRVLRPGRCAVLHVKDRITPGGINKLGFQTVEPFSDETVAAFRKHGLGFLARKTIVTDVVRENNQTYRLGWTEQCKDGTKMGAGLPEYLLIFRKPPTDRSNGYADVPVVKSKESYSRGRWQFDAHGFMRSSGNRLLTATDLRGKSKREIYRLFREHSLATVYDFEHDVQLADATDALKMLPTTFMLLQPRSWHPDVWTDVMRARTLNTRQAQRNRDQHLCPLQEDIARRVIEQLSMPGETVWDPFAGIGSVPYYAVLLGRFGLGTELSTDYYLESVAILRAAEAEISVPRLFDLDDIPNDEEAWIEDVAPNGGEMEAPLAVDSRCDPRPYVPLVKEVL